MELTEMNPIHAREYLRIVQVLSPSATNSAMPDCIGCFDSSELRRGANLEHPLVWFARKKQTHLLADVLNYQQLPKRRIRGISSFHYSK